jgi:hypothetical protein
MVWGRVPTDETRAYLNGLAIRADDLVGDQWAAVSRIAQALLERGRLSGTAALRLCREWTATMYLDSACLNERHVDKSL